MSSPAVTYPFAEDSAAECQNLIRVSLEGVGSPELASSRMPWEDTPPGESVEIRGEMPSYGLGFHPSSPGSRRSILSRCTQGWTIQPAMQTLGALCHIFYGILSLILGVRLLLRGLRTKSEAERLLGLALLGLGGIGFLCLLVPAAIGPEVQTPLTIGFSVVGRILMDSGMIAMLAFTVVVFRPGEPVARRIAVSLAVILAASVAGMFATGDWWGRDVGSVAFWVEMVGAQTVLAWAAGEAWNYRMKLRRRQALGLASDPEVQNRVLLWAGFGMAQFSMMAAVSVSTWIYASTGRIVLGLDAVIAACGFASAVCLWLAFWPPRAFRTWLNGVASQST